MLPAVVFSIGSSARSATPVEHRVGRGAERVVPGEQRAARATTVAPLRREVAVAALDALVRDPQRRIAPRRARRLLVRDRHVHDHAVQPLDLVRIEARPRSRARAAAQEQPLLALAVAERARGRELRRRDLLDDAQPLGEERDDLAIDRFDAVAERREIGGRHARTVLSYER